VAHGNADPAEIPPKIGNDNHDREGEIPRRNPRAIGNEIHDLNGISYFFALSPSSTRRRMASGREG